MKRFITVVAKRRGYPIAKLTFKYYSGDVCKPTETGTPSIKDYENTMKEFEEYVSNAKYILGDVSEVSEEMRSRAMEVFLREQMKLSAHRINTKLSAHKSEQDMSFLYNFHASEMASFQQRCIMESLFEHCVCAFCNLVEEEKLMCVDDPKTSALEEAAKRHFKTKTLPNFHDENVPIQMSDVNWLLRCDEVRSVLFDKIGLGDVKYPIFLDQKFLMGCLSDNDYYMFIKTLYVANNDNEDLKNLLKAYAKILIIKDVQEYDPFTAFRGKELIRTANIQLTRSSLYR